MKQFESVAPDFTELLKCIQDLISVNKPFYEVGCSCNKTFYSCLTFFAEINSIR